MSLSSLQVLADNRDALLLAEIGALLHDVGKLHSGFLFCNPKQHLWADYHHLVLQRVVRGVTRLTSLSTDQISRAIAEARRELSANTADKRLLRERIRAASSVSRHQAEVLLGEALVPDDFLTAEFLKWIEKAPIRIQNGRSVVEECVVGDLIEEHHTPFFSRKSGQRNERQKISKILQHSDFCDSAADKGDAVASQQNGTFVSTAFGIETGLEALDNRRFCQEAFQKVESRRDLFQTIEHFYSKALGETRRGANDVTLWDHSYSVAALFKSALGSAVLKGWPSDPRTLRWRLLRVNFDVLGLFAKAIKIADLLAYQEAVQQACDDVKQLIEEEYPLGNEVYRDTTGIYFTFPDLGLWDELSNLLRQKVEEVEFEIAPRVTLDTPEGSTPTEQLKRMLADARQEARRELAQPFSKQNWSQYWQKEWEKAGEGDWEVCPICRLRLMEEGREACEHCLGRRDSRIQAWLENPRQTIWMDEIADRNGRVALIVGKFGLEDWLSGDLVQTMLVQAAEDEPGRCRPKNPSPARLRRVWETTRRFWTETVDDLLKTIPERKRWELVSEAPLGANVPPEMTVCDGTLNGKPISVLRVGDQLVTVSFVEEPEPGKLSISWEEGRRREQATVKITEVKPAQGRLSKYRSHVPYLRLLASPDQFLALVPAGDALHITERVREEYCKQFSKVRNRLPLFLGLVFFRRKMPLMAVIDTARRMLDTVPLGEERGWKVIGNEECGAGVTPEFLKESKHFEKWRKLTLEKGGQRVEWAVSTVMGDGTTSDEWYPYFFVEGDPGPRRLRFQLRGEGETDPRKVGRVKKEYADRWLVHVNNLREGDQVTVSPSRFAYVYLDHTARRFEYDPEKDVFLLDELPHLVRMWQDICNTPDMTDTKLHSLWALLEGKWAFWRLGEACGPDCQDRLKTFRQLAEAALRRDRLLWDGTRGVSVDDVVAGRFRRCLELHLDILKLRVKEGKSGQQPSKTAV